MTNYVFLTGLQEKGTLKELQERGLLAPNLTTYIQVYEHYQLNISRGKKSMEAIEDVKVTFKVSQNTVYRALRTMK